MAHTVGRNEVDIDDIPEIIPLNEYNFKKAKLRVSLGWIGCKAYHGHDTNVPEDLLQPFFKDEKGHDNLKPSVINQLASGELYSLACSNIFPPSIHPWRGHASVIHALSRKGIYVLDGGEPVSEVSLTHTQRIKLSSHQAMIGAIMKAYAKEVVPVEAVVKAVRQIATFNASSELPFDQEDALLFWINKVCSSVRHRLERERKAQQEQLMQSAQQTVRLRRDQLHPKQLPFIPVLDDLMKDLSDGCCLAILVSFYCPHLLPFEDIVLRENMSFADSLHNLQLLKTFFKKYLPETFHFTFEDLLYTHDSLKPSIIAFCSELFHVFEVTKPDHLSANQFKGTTRIGSSPSVSLARENLPISDVTKRSFHPGGSPSGQNTRSFHMSGDVRASNSPGFQQRLLPGRQQKRSSMVIEGNPPQYQDEDLRRSTSLEDLSPDKPVAAWQSPEIIRSSDVPGFRNNTSQGLLANVSIDSEVGESQAFQQDLDVGHSQETYLVASNQRKLSREGKPIPALPSADDDRDDSEVAALTSRTFDVRASPRDDGRNHHSEHCAAGGDAGSKNRHGMSTHDRLGFQPLDLPPAGITSQSADARKRMRLDLSPADIKSHSVGSVPRERLLPSPGRTSKEATQSASKVAEYGERGSKTLPSKGRGSGTDKSSMISWEQRIQNDQKTTPESLDSSTPLSGETVIDTFAFRDEAQKQNAKKKWANQAFQQAEQKTSNGTPHVTKTKHGEAFFVSHDPRTETHPTNPQETGKSFVLSDKDYDEQSAQQAGIPVVTTSIQDLNGPPHYEEKWHHQDLTHPNNMQFVANPALSVSRSAHDPHSHLKANHSPVNVDRVSVASDSAMFLHARSRSPRHFFLSDYSPSHASQSGYNMDATNEGRVNGSSLCNPLSTSDLACHSDESPKLHAELLESESGSKLSHIGQDVYPVEGFMLPANDGDSPVLLNGMVDPQDTSQSDSGELQLNDLTSITAQNVHMHEQIIGVENDATKDHMITWLANSKPAHTSNTINSGPDAGYGVGTEPALSDLAQIRMQLEKKRRHIDHEKRKLERQWHKQRMKVNKEAFLQCVTQKKPQEDHVIPQGRYMPDPQITPPRDIYPASTKITFADISAKKDKQMKMKDELKAFSDSSQSGRSATDSGSNRSGSPTSSAGSHSPQLTNEEYNASLEKLNANLSELQSQITRLSLQQEQHIKSSQVSPRANTSDLPGGTDIDGRTFQVAGHPENSSLQDRSVDVPAQMQTWLRQSPRPIGPIVQNQEEFRNLRSSWIEQSNMKDESKEGIKIDPSHESGKFAKTFTVQGNTEEIPDTSQVDGTLHTPVKMEEAPVKMDEAPPSIEESQSGKKQMYMEINLSPEKKVPPKPKLSVKSKPALSEKRNVNPAEEAKDVTVEVTRQETPRTPRKEELNETTSSSASDEKPVGFVVEMAEQKDDEMAKRREVFLKAQLKRQEMERKKKAAREEEIEKQREERRKKQEEQEQKKAEEKARREQIMAEYQQRKKREQDGEPERPPKPKAKSRPKSRVIADSSSVKQPVLSGSEPTTARLDTTDGLNNSTPSSSAFSKIKADKTFRALPDKQGPRITPKKTPSPESPAKSANGAATPIKRSGSFKGSSSRPPSPGRSSPGRRSPSPRPPSPLMQRRRSNTLPGSLKSEDTEEGDKTAASGPKLYVRPTSRSNKNLICNAISHCVLAGVPNIPQRDKVLEEVNKSDHKHFVILFRDQGLQFRAVYGFNPETEEMSKVYGTGPRHITNKMLECIYKYDSGSKKFSKIHSKTMSVQVDGLIIGQMYWQSKKTSAKR